MREQINAVLAGCGGISRAWLDAVRDIPDLRMAGFVDIREEAARARAEEYGWHGAIVGRELTTVLAATRPGVVFDCTVPEAHLGVTLEALRHGCHVLGEKPLADSMTHARQAVEAAQAAGKIYAVMQNRRFDANIRRLCRFLASGAIGPVTTVNCDFYIGAHFGGFRDHMAHVLLLDMAIHTFDAARLICRRRSAGRLLPRMESGRLVVRSRRVRGRGVRDDGRDRLHLPGKLVRRRSPHDLGERVAHHRHARAA